MKKPDILKYLTPEDINITAVRFETTAACVGTILQKQVPPTKTEKRILNALYRVARRNKQAIRSTRRISPVKV